MGTIKSWARGKASARATHAFKHARTLSALTLVALITTACPSGNTGSQGTSRGVASTSGASGSGSGTIGGDTSTSGDESFIKVNDVVRSNRDPNSLLELIGENGQIGTQCPTVNDCSCVFSWTESNGFLKESEQVPSLVETNMMRCLFTTVTGTASYFDVKIKIKSADLSSNSKRVFMTSPNPDLDPSIASNYLPVQRFMCRDVLGADANTNYYRSNLIDPRLWTSTYSLAYNFYTTSFGRDYGATAQTRRDGTQVTVPGYECPMIPNDISESPLYNLKLYTLDKVDITNPSLTDVVNGDNTIYPPDDNGGLAAAKCPTGSEPTCEKFAANRHDFMLSSFKSGIFKQRVCVFHTVANVGAAGGAGLMDCTVDTSAAAGIVGATNVGEDVIGFAAMPDANQKCPDINTVKLPSGKKWGKLWQFRVSYGKRQISQISNSSDIGELYCTNREQECMSNDAAVADGTDGDAVAVGVQWPVVSVCYNARNATGPTIGPQLTPRGTGNCSTSANAGVNARGPLLNGPYPGITGTCKGKNSWFGAATEFNCCEDLNAPDANGNFPSKSNRPANFTDGGDVCNPALIGAHNASAMATAAGDMNLCGPVNSCVETFAGEGGLAKDIWLIGNGNKRACIEADTDNLGNLRMAQFPPAAAANPFGGLAPKEIDAESRFDVVYVVTPESVTFEAMQDPEHNKIARQYTPYRLDTDGITKIFYRLDSDSQNGNDAEGRLSKYPLCVLQDAKQGANGGFQ